MKHKNCPEIDGIKMIEGNSISLDYALFLQRCWRKEIVRAINEIKNSRKRSEMDKWYRRKFYISQAIDRKRSLRTSQLARW